MFKNENLAFSQLIELTSWEAQQTSKGQGSYGHEKSWNLKMHFPGLEKSWNLGKMTKVMEKS